MKIGDIIRHFKFELLSDAEKAQNKYIYRVESFATNTVTEEEMVIYRSLFGNGKAWVRPLSEFTDKVDKNKYPTVKQELRFEIINHED